MKKSKLAPIILFVYNRPWHTQQTIEALQKNELASESELYIYADGAKQEKDTKVTEVRKYIKTITGFKNVTIIERDKNWGLADNIINGVTEIVNKYGKIIVLEDDIVTVIGFLKYMNEALNIYEFKDRVRQISGYQYQIDLKNTGFNNPILHRRTTSWGWATWKRAWSLFNIDVEYLINSFTINKKYRFNIDGTINRFGMLELQKQEKINSWAIRWAATLHLKNSLVLWPPYSFIKNIGHDGSGVHCGFDSVLNSINFNDKRAKPVFVYPIKIKENRKYLLQIKKYNYSFNKKKRYKKIYFLIKHYYSVFIKK